MTSQKFIYKIHSQRLREAKWNLHIDKEEAKRNNEIITIADSTVMRWIDELNNIKDTEEQVKDIRKELKKLKKQPKTLENSKLIKNKYNKLDEIQFKSDYLVIIIDKLKDFHTINKIGFSINGIRYKRFVGTPNGVKRSCIVFVSENLYPELNRRINNDRNMDKDLVPAKLEAYKSLSCSTSLPVSNPKGVLVVNDCITHFKSDIISIDDTEDGEPKLKEVKDAEVELIDSDGYGLCLPELSLQWSNDIQEKEPYISSGYCIRNAFTKGMVFTFDFRDFASKIAKTELVTDAWGHIHNINDIDLVLTTSMLKLWDSYDSIEDYLSKCQKNGYCFSITKNCPKELENERNLNYQFLQSYNLTDKQIRELVQPTIDDIKDVLGDDYIKSTLFLKGSHLNESNVEAVDFDFAKALMIDKRMINDPFVRNKIYQMIRKRIKEAKIGCVKVKGNFSIVSGDPYSLCQSMFGLTITGLLKSGQAYAKYWSDKNVDKVVCFRAPMTCHNNIRVLNITATKDMKYWYRYMTTCTIFNSWDTAAHALNGLDKDSDQILTTNNPILINNTRELPAIMCIQRRAEKKIVSEDDLVKANINGFGDDIGSTTNRITNMFEVQSQYSPKSKQYKILDYRICCGQLFQQNAIDKTKGIIAKEMPKSWYDRHSNNILDTDLPDVVSNKKLNKAILADKKPYFMCYRYQETINEYKKYIQNTKEKCYRLFRKSIDELDFGIEEEKEFLQCYKRNMPVGKNKCLVNSICWIFEKEFSDIKTIYNDFDYSILKSDTDYSKNTYKKVLEKYNEYNQQIQEHSRMAKTKHLESDDNSSYRKILIFEFKKKCETICSNEDELCNIVLNICYSNNNTKQFAWDVCGNTIINNLLKQNNYMISYPELNSEGDIYYGGERFKIGQKRMEDID